MYKQNNSESPPKILYCSPVERNDSLKTVYLIFVCALLK